MAALRLIDLTKLYGASRSVDGIDATIGEGEFFSLLGPSGCGKSTTLRMIAGFVTPSSGRILIGDDDITPLPPERRGIGIVFQNYAIFPHMNVAENIAFGLRLRHVPKDEITRRVTDALRQVGLSGFGDRYQRQLSGGEQQRVALARVLVTEPRILLLDEPLSALDKSLREEMKFWIKDLQRKLNITTIYVTHDQDEALTMSDRIAVMQKGKIVQVGTPEAIYERPETLFVTSFIGHSNVLDVSVLAKPDFELLLRLGDWSIAAPVSAFSKIDMAARLAIRPENVIIGEKPGAPIQLPATVLDVTYRGPLLRYRLRLGTQELFAEVQNQAGHQRYEPGTAVTIGWDPSCSVVLADK
jgi:putative spermidine/putrescine transport system ATP-binding protein